MKIPRKSKIRALEASSPGQLKEQLEEVIKKEHAKPGPVAVSISDPKVMICPFQLEDVAVKDLEPHLISEAVEITSLTPDEIVIDAQVLKSEDKKLQGIYACIPKKLFEAYLAVLDKKFFNPVKITEQFLVSVDWLLQQGKLAEKRICFFDFTCANTANLFVSHDGECELLRKIHFEDPEEAQREINLSLRSASAKGRKKTYDAFYYYGGDNGTDALMEALKQKFQTEIERLSAVDQKAALVDDKNYFSLNLLRTYNFSPKQLLWINAAANILISLCILKLGLTGLQLVKKKIEISHVQERYQDSEIQYALELKENLKE